MGIRYILTKQKHGNTSFLFHVSMSSKEIVYTDIRYICIVNTVWRVYVVFCHTKHRALSHVCLIFNKKINNNNNKDFY